MLMLITSLNLRIKRGGAKKWFDGEMTPCVFISLFRGSGLGGGGGYKCQVSVKILAIFQLSVKFKAICQLSVNLLLIIN